MRKFYYICLLMVTILAATSCHEEEEVLSDIGYLNLSIDTRLSVKPGSRKIISGYDPTRLAVQILNSANRVVYETTDYDSWELKDKNFPLKEGNYTVKAQSYGFDGKDSGFDIPYYVGSTQIKVQKGVLKTADVVCTQANVKVTVNFDKDFVEGFKTAKVLVSSVVKGVAPMEFRMGSTTSSAYFPVGNLSAKISVVNKFNKEFSKVDDFAKNVKPRSHYILTYKVADSGSLNDIIVETDEKERIYRFTFKVSTQPVTKLGAGIPSVWSNFAILNGEILAEKANTKLEPELMKFQYKATTSEQWITTDAEVNGEKKFKAKITGLEPMVKYSFRMIYTGKEEIISNELVFTTESAAALPNSNLDEWFKLEQTWYAAPNNSKIFWDSSNPGTTTGAGSLVNINPTEGVTSPVHTAGGKAARLKSQFASAFGIGKFAAGSLYTGRFKDLVGTNGAILKMGRPFVSRPTQFTGWFQYAPGKIDYVGSNQPSGTVKKGDTDLWSAYIALTTDEFELNNTDLEGTAWDFEKLLNDPADQKVVAYGVLPDAECAASSEWKKFTIDLVYKDLERKPTHIVIVMSSSKYGDYFTGATGSTLYLDDLELVYGDNPQTK